jgi:DNA repair exonuclease SbcCD ATPase subunit
MARSGPTEDVHREDIVKQTDEISAALYRAKEYQRERLSDKERILAELGKAVETLKRGRNELETRVKNDLRELMPTHTLRDIEEVDATRAHVAETVFITCQSAITEQTEALKNEEKSIETMGNSLRRTEADLNVERDQLGRLELEISQFTRTLQVKLAESTQKLRAELDQKKTDVQRRLRELDENIERRTQALQLRMDEKAKEVNEVIQDMYQDAGQRA